MSKSPLHVVIATAPAPLFKLTPKPAPIGTKYTGKHTGFADLTTGVYWESMYQLSPDEARIQQALLKPAPKGAPLAARVRITARIKEYLTKLKGLADSGNIVP